MCVRKAIENIFITLRATNIHGETYNDGMPQLCVMLCCVERTSNYAGQRRDIRLTGMLPIGHPSQALCRPGSGIVILKDGNVVDMTAGQYQGTICGREQIVQL